MDREVPNMKVRKLRAQNEQIGHALNLGDTDWIAELVGVDSELDRVRRGLEEYKKINNRKFLSTSEYLFVLVRLGWSPPNGKAEDNSEGDQGRNQSENEGI